MCDWTIDRISNLGEKIVLNIAKCMHAWMDGVERELREYVGADSWVNFVKHGETHIENMLLLHMKYQVLMD